MEKFRLKLKKVGKTTRPAKYDLNQIPYEYAVEVTNRFKGLDLVKSVPEELWMEVCKYCTGGSEQNHSKEKEKQEGKWLSEEALQIAKDRREAKREKGKSASS